MYCLKVTIKFKKTKQKQSNKATTHACVYVLSLYKKINSPKSGPCGPGSRCSSDQGSTAMAHEMVLVCLRPRYFTGKYCYFKNFNEKY